MKPMSKIVTTITGLIFWFVLVFGIYVVLHGHLTPGGGFQGGAVLASAVALLLVAVGKEKGKILLTGKEGFSAFESIGLLGFIGLACLGFGATFFYNFLAGRGGLFGNPVPPGINPGDLNTAGVIPLMNVSVGLEVICGISLIVIFMLWGQEQELFPGGGGKENG